jgi:S1-C subfamily serine protease
MHDGRYDNDRRRFTTLPILIILAAIVAVGAFAWARFADRGADRDYGLPLRAITPRGELADYERTNIDIFRRSLPSVASVTTKELRRRFRGQAIETEQGSGSGIVWDQRGHVVTNFHVIEGEEQRVRGGPKRPKIADRVIVQLATMADPVNAKVVGIAPEYDLAVLRIEAPQDVLAPIAVGSSSDLQVGQSVIAIGNPFGLSQSMTTGIVSQLNRRLEGANGRIIEDVIQTDAAINPGNSGGPLIDSAGRLIGVNSAIYSKDSRETGNIGIGFAIPIDTVNWVVGMLIRHGKIVRPLIGAGLQATSTLSFWRGTEGLYVTQVVAGGPAEAAGLRAVQLDAQGMKILRHGDVLTHVDGKRVQRLGEFQAVLEGAREQDTVQIRYERDGKSAECSVKLVAYDYFERQDR